MKEEVCENGSGWAVAVRAKRSPDRERCAALSGWKDSQGRPPERAACKTDATPQWEVTRETPRNVEVLALPPRLGSGLYGAGLRDCRRILHYHPGLRRRHRACAITEASKGSHGRGSSSIGPSPSAT